MKDGVLDREEALGGVGQGALARNMNSTPPGRGGLGGSGGVPKSTKNGQKCHFLPKNPQKWSKLAIFALKYHVFWGVLGGPGPIRTLFCVFSKFRASPGLGWGPEKVLQT